MDQPQNSRDQQQEGPTLEELRQGWQQGGEAKLSQMMVRADGKKMIPSPKDFFLAYRDGGKEMLGALMSQMSGDEEGDYPEWDERRWR